MTGILGRTVGRPITAAELETVTAPESVASVTFETGELSALCPVTRQPDIYHAEISYVPNGASLESKALKHYLWGFRNEGIFAEDLAHRIASDLAVQLTCSVTVELRQQVRGGLTLTVLAEVGAP